MNTTVQQYLAGLQLAYTDNQGKALWEHFEQIKQGAAPEHLERLRLIYPDIPEALISLLQYVDGTYFRDYGGETLSFCLLGSDVFEYPYYLLSAQEMIDNREMATQHYADYIARQYDEVDIDDRITHDVDTVRWLHFSDCINNGGTSQLFIDFSPSPSGKTGQVVRFLHDPDELKVIADSFADYLQMLMDNGYDFIHEDLLE
jgi:hypothetical protein